MSHIELYDRQDCPYSRRVREKLDELGLAYEETIVPDAHAERSEVEQRTGQTGVPVLFDEQSSEAFITDSQEIVDYLDRVYG